MSRPQWPGRSRALPSPNFHIDNWQHWHWLFPHFHIFTLPRADGSRSEVAYQFPNFGAVAPSVPLCLCVRKIKPFKLMTGGLEFGMMVA